MSFNETISRILSDVSIEDIHFSPAGISHFSKNKWHLESVPVNHTELWTFARLLAENAHSELGISNPSVDSHYEFRNSLGIHKFRAHVICSPMVLSGPQITLRRLKEMKDISLDLFNLDSAVTDQIGARVKRGESFLIVGPTGAGKTTLLCALLNLVPNQERIVILEDSLEIPFNRPLCSHLISRQVRFAERSGSTWNLSHLVWEALRMRPNRIVLGECRGKEAFAIYQALYTGHKGVVTTLHGSSLKEAQVRFTDLVNLGAKEEIQGNFQFGPEEFQSSWDNILVIEPSTRSLKEAKWKNS